MKTREFIRWLVASGVRIEAGKGSHLKLYFEGRRSVLPVHSGELSPILLRAIKRQLGLPMADRRGD